MVIMIGFSLVKSSIAESSQGSVSSVSPMLSYANGPTVPIVSLAEKHKQPLPHPKDNYFDVDDFNFDLDYRK
jgi:hypothetical protein